MPAFRNLNLTTFQRHLVLRQVLSITVGFALIIGVVVYYAFNGSDDDNNWGWIYVGFAVIVGLLVCVAPAVNNLIRYRRTNANVITVQAVDGNTGRNTGRRQTIDINNLGATNANGAQINYAVSFSQRHLPVDTLQSRVNPEAAPELAPQYMNNLNYDSELFAEAPPSYDEVAKKEAGQR